VKKGVQPLKILISWAIFI